MTTYPKPSVSADRAIRQKARAALERLENVKVKARSGGRCEVVVVWRSQSPLWRPQCQCQHQATEIHHMIGGRMRGKGNSALAQHKQHVCHSCHRDLTGDIGGKRLMRVGGPVPRWSDPYRRVR